MLKEGLIKRAFLGGTAALVLTFLGFSVLTPGAEKADATIDPDTYSLNLSSTKPSRLQLSPTSTGSISATKSTVTGSTTAGAGYQLYISMGGSDTSLRAIGGDGQTIPATSATSSSPAAMALSGSTHAQWGYAIAGSPFDSSYDLSNISATSKWAKVPAASAPVKAASYSGTGSHSSDIYFGVLADSTVSAEIYSGVIAFSALVDVTNSSTGEAEVVLPAGGSTTNLAAQTIKVKTSLKLIGNLLPGTVTATVGGATCGSPTTEIVNGIVVVTCQAPAASAGSKTVSVKFANYGNKEYTATLKYLQPRTLTLAAAPAKTTLTVTRDGETLANGATIYDGDVLSVTVATTDSCETGLSFKVNGTDQNKKSGTVTVSGDTRIEAVAASCVKYMQDVSTWGSSLNAGDSIQVVDKRDQKTYWVTKFNTSASETEIWMTQNLDYDLRASNCLDCPNGQCGSSYTVSCASLNTTTSDVTAARTLTPANTTTAWGSSYETVYHRDGGNVYKPGGKDYSNANLSADTLAADSENWHYHIGDYYSWHAATATTGNKTQSGAIASDSICPAGWRLPYSKDSTTARSFGKMLSYNTGGTDKDKILQAPFYFVRAGYVSGSSVSGEGTGGYVWSSVSYGKNSSNYFAYFLYFGSSSVNPSNYGRQYLGVSVRCVAK